MDITNTTDVVLSYEDIRYRLSLKTPPPIEGKTDPVTLAKEAIVDETGVHELTKKEIVQRDTNNRPYIKLSKETKCTMEEYKGVLSRVLDWISKERMLLAKTVEELENTEEPDEKTREFIDDLILFKNAQKSVKESKKELEEERKKFPMIELSGTDGKHTNASLQVDNTVHTLSISSQSFPRLKDDMERIRHVKILLSEVGSSPFVLFQEVNKEEKKVTEGNINRFREALGKVEKWVKREDVLKRMGVSRLAEEENEDGYLLALMEKKEAVRVLRDTKKRLQHSRSMFPAVLLRYKDRSSENVNMSHYTLQYDLTNVSQVSYDVTGRTVKTKSVEHEVELHQEEKGLIEQDQLDACRDLMLSIQERVQLEKDAMPASFLKESTETVSKGYNMAPLFFEFAMKNSKQGRKVKKNENGKYEVTSNLMDHMKTRFRKWIGRDMTNEEEENIKNSIVLK